MYQVVTIELLTCRDILHFWKSIKLDTNYGFLCVFNVAIHRHVILYSYIASQEQFSTVINFRAPQFHNSYLFCLSCCFKGLF